MNLGTTSDQPSFFFKIPGTSFNFTVLSFEAVEAISSPFQANVTAGCEDVIAFEDLAGKSAVLTIVSEDLTGEDRYFHGEIVKFKQIGDNGDFYLYRLRLVPAILRLSFEQDCRIFQNTTLKSIIQTVLSESGITGDMYRFALKDEELKARYCVQYNESDLNFISRLLEEEGIYYFFEQHEDKHVIVFCDFTFFCGKVGGNSVIAYGTPDGMVTEGETITAFNLSKRLSPDMVTTRSFNYKRTALDLTSKDDAGKDGRAEIYEYTGAYASEQRGRKLAKMRMEEHSALEKKGKGESNCPRLIPGFTFTLEGADMEEHDGTYLLLAVEHVGDQPQSLESQGGGSTEYWNGFICVPADVNLRPRRITPKPVIPGMQTAIVTGPPGEEIYQDELGRVKVQFHWDRKGSRNEKSSCWLRYAQGWGGGGWGMQFVPRVGDEVLVAFLDGDPDRPVIVGSLYNGSNMPLYAPVERNTVSCIRTRSYPNGGSDNFHELRFDDKKGSEEVYLQSERDWNVLVKNDKGEMVGNDESLKVGNNRTKVVGADQSEIIGSNKMIQVGGDHCETIAANMSLVVASSKTETVAVNSMESIGLAKELSIGGAYAVTVAGAMNTAVGLGHFEEVGLSKEVRVGKSLKMVAAESIEIICGKSSIKMDEAGNVVIEGAKLNICGGDSVQVTAERIDLN